MEAFLHREANLKVLGKFLRPIVASKAIDITALERQSNQILGSKPTSNRDL